MVQLDKVVGTLESFISKTMFLTKGRYSWTLIFLRFESLELDYLFWTTLCELHFVVASKPSWYRVRHFAYRLHKSGIRYSTIRVYSNISVVRTVINNNFGILRPGWKLISFMAQSKGRRTRFFVSQIPLWCNFRWMLSIELWRYAPTNAGQVRVGWPRHRCREILQNGF